MHTEITTSDRLRETSRLRGQDDLFIEAHWSEAVMCRRIGEPQLVLTLTAFAMGMVFSV